jgi:hypothetical protein
VLASLSFALILLLSRIPQGRAHDAKTGPKQEMNFQTSRFPVDTGDSTIHTGWYVTGYTKTPVVGQPSHAIQRAHESAY